jgi:hypothetical protein
LVFFYLYSLASLAGCAFVQELRRSRKSNGHS